MYPHFTAFKTIRELYLDSAKIDPVTVLTKMADPDPNCRAWMLGVMDTTPTAANVLEYASVVREQSRLRSIQALGAQLSSAYSDGDLSVVMNTDGSIIFTNTAHNLNAVTVGRLFDRFYTVEASRNSTGLGLSIAKLLIERMDGSIEAIYNKNKLQIKITFAN